MVELITTAEQLIALSKRIQAATEPITLDTETNGLFPITDKIIGFSVSFDEADGFYIPVSHRRGPNIPKELATKILQRLQEKKLVYHNARFDIEFIKANFGLEMPVYADTMLMAYLMCFTDLSLKGIAKALLGQDTVEFDELLERKYGKQWSAQGYTAADLDPEEMYEYASNDTRFTYMLFNLLKDEMKQFSSILKIETNLIPIVARMNMQGMEIDVEPLERMAQEAKLEVADKIQQMRDIAGPSFEPNSHRQVAKVLFEDLNLPVLKRSKKSGAPSSDAEVLEQLAPMHAFPQLLIDYRSENKFISGYLEKIPSIVRRVGKLYANFKSIGAESGRFTCPGTSDWTGTDVTVNLQNQPVHERFDVRASYIAPEGWHFVKCDYSQIEYRMMNNLAGEQNAIQQFKAGVDFHTATATMMLDMEPGHELTRDERQIGKVLNFGMSYGMAIPTVAKMIGKSESEATLLYNKYFDALPRLRDFIGYCQQQVKDHGQVKTLFGRMRKLNLEGLPPRVKEDTIKKGFNTVIQGSAADFLKIAMIRINERVLKKYGEDKVRLILCVHDELDFYIKDEYLEEIMIEIKKAMEIPVPAEWAPFVCDVEYGPNWSEPSHKDFIPTAEQYTPEPFTGWGDILPKNISSYLEDPEYSARW